MGEVNHELGLKKGVIINKGGAREGENLASGHIAKFSG